MFKALITGVTMGLWLAISVGPILFTVINHRLNYGIKGGFCFVAGIWLSDLLFVLLSNVFTVFTKTFADAYIRQIGYGGGLLLIGLGIYYVFVKVAAMAPASGKSTPISNSSMLKLFGAGFVINTVNPILFFEWLTAATVFAATYSVNDRIVLFAACLSINVLSDVTKIFLAGKIRERLTPGHLNIINRGTGVILLVCGFFLLYQTRFNAEKWKAAMISNKGAVASGVNG